MLQALKNVGTSAAIYLARCLINIEGMRCPICHKNRACSQFEKSTDDLRLPDWDRGCKDCIEKSNREAKPEAKLIEWPVRENIYVDPAPVRKMPFPIVPVKVPNPNYTPARRRATISEKKFEVLSRSYLDRCYYCLTPLTRYAQKEHFIPFSKGGSCDMSNIVPSCVSCNSKKHTKMPWEFKEGEGEIPKTPEQWKLENGFVS